MWQMLQHPAGAVSLRRRCSLCQHESVVSAAAAAAAAASSQALCMQLHCALRSRCCSDCACRTNKTVSFGRLCLHCWSQSTVVSAMAMSWLACSCWRAAVWVSLATSVRRTAKHTCRRFCCCSFCCAAAALPAITHRSHTAHKLLLCLQCVPCLWHTWCGQQQHQQQRMGHTRGHPRAGQCPPTRAAV